MAWFAAGVAAIGAVMAFGKKKKRGPPPGPPPEVLAQMQQQREQMEALQRQLEQQQREKEEMLRQLHLEEQERMRENTRFQDEMNRMKQDGEAQRAQHQAEMKNMETEALRTRLMQTNQHIHDLESELMRCENVYNGLKEELEETAEQICDERTKIAHFEFERADPSIKSLVVLGMTGDGKSTLCNRLCGDESTYGEEGRFVVSDSIESETVVVCKHLYEFAGVRISVVDTPGIADSQSRDREHVNNVITYLRGSNGVNQFLIVKNIANPRFSSHYREMLRQFEHFLGDQFWNFVTVVLTHFDGHNKRKFAVVKREVMRQLNEDHPTTADRELPVLGVGFDDYKESLTNLVQDIVPFERYTCEYLTSPLEDLEAELEASKETVEKAYEDVTRTKQRLELLQKQKNDIESRLG